MKANKKSLQFWYRREAMDAENKIYYYLYHEGGVGYGLYTMRGI